MLNLSHKIFVLYQLFGMFFNLSVIVTSFPEVLKMADAPERQFQWTEVEMHISASEQEMTATLILIHSLLSTSMPNCNVFGNNNNKLPILLLSIIFIINNTCNFYSLWKPFWISESLCLWHSITIIKGTFRQHDFACDSIRSDLNRLRISIVSCKTNLRRSQGIVAIVWKIASC